VVLVICRYGFRFMLAVNTVAVVTATPLHPARRLARRHLVGGPRAPVTRHVLNPRHWR
jgi:hypothetical protein